MPSVDEFRRAVAPSGNLRAAINLGNPILAGIAADGQPKGVSVDIARSLADRLGIGFDPCAFATARESVQAVNSGTVDLGFFAVDPARGNGMLFSSPYVIIEGSYLVRKESPIRENDDVDQPNIRIAVGDGSAYDHHLTRNIRYASLTRAPTSPAVVSFFLENNLEVAAGVRQQLELDANGRDDLRILPGRFMEIQQAVGVSESRGAAVAAYIQNYLDDIRDNGILARLLERHGISGVRIP